MIAADVAALYEALDRAGVRIWIDGGWAVDALLGRETRPHGDLDIAVAARDLPALRTLLAARGFSDSARADTTPWNFVLTDTGGRTLDVHAFVLDAEGAGVLGPAALGHNYPAGSLEGHGVIAGTPVRCVAARFLVRFKTSYAPRAIDRADVAALCARFGLPSPLA